MTTLTTLDVCRLLQLTEPALRHILRRPGAPKPSLHPTARLFLWSLDDVRNLAAFLGVPIELGELAEDKRATLDPDSEYPE